MIKYLIGWPALDSRKQNIHTEVTTHLKNSKIFHRHCRYPRKCIVKNSRRFHAVLHEQQLKRPLMAKHPIIYSTANKQDAIKVHRRAEVSSVSLKKKIGWLSNNVEFERMLHVTWITLNLFPWTHEQISIISVIGNYLASSRYS